MFKNAICNFEDYYSIQVCKDYFKSLFHVQTGKVLLTKPPNSQLSFLFGRGLGAYVVVPKSKPIIQIKYCLLFPLWIKSFQSSITSVSIFCEKHQVVTNLQLHFCHKSIPNTFTFVSITYSKSFSNCKSQLSMSMYLNMFLLFFSIFSLSIIKFNVVQANINQE